MTERIVKINIETSVGNQIYWLIVTLMDKHSDTFEVIEGTESDDNT